MRTLIFALLRAPWWIHIALAAAAACGGYALGGQEDRVEAELAQALAQEPPATIALEEWQPETHLGLLDEGRVLGTLNFDHNTRLIERRNGIKTKETLMYVLQGQFEPESTTTIRALVMVKPDDIDRFVEMVLDQPIVDGPGGAATLIHGSFDTYHSQRSHAHEVLEKKGLRPAKDLQFIEPYLDGREAGLRDQAASAQGLQGIMYWIAAAFAAFSAIKLVLARRGSRQTVSPSGATAFAPTPDHSDHGKIPEEAWSNPHAVPKTSGKASADPLAALHSAPTGPQPYAPPARGPAMAGPKASRAAALLAKQQEAAAQVGPGPSAKPMTALEKARAFRKSVSAPNKPQTFKQKLKQDPFAKLAGET